MKAIEGRRLRIETKFYVPHRESELTFLHPSYGPNTYAHVASAIEKDGLATPTLAETTAVMYALSHEDNRYAEDIKDLMRERWLWGFTGTLYIPGKGAYIQDHPAIRDNKIHMEESELVAMLERSDPNVRFVSFGYQTREMTSRALAKNAYAQGLVGQEGAEQLAEIADRHKGKAFLWSSRAVDQPTTKASALVSGARNLHVTGYYHDDGCGGCAFGVQKTSAASRT